MPTYEVYNGRSRPTYATLINNMLNANGRIYTNYITPNQETNYIHIYNYIPPEFIFHKISDEEELYLGIELEIDKGGKNDKNAKMILDFMGKQNVYCKHDGSLSDGFEIVSHPCTYEYHLTLPYEELFQKLVNLKYKSHDTNTCGLHVHINRNYFGKDKLLQDLNLSKLLYLFEKFWDNIVIIARRNSNFYASRYNINNNDTILDMYAKTKNGSNHKIIDLTHKDTYEIRIFKGTLNYSTFISTLCFVKTIILYIKNIDIYDIQSIIWEDIYNQFDNNLKQYFKERKEKYNDDINTYSSTNTLLQGCTPGYLTSWDIMPLTTATAATTATASSSLEEVATRLSDEQISDEQIIRHKINMLNRELSTCRNPRHRQQLTNEIREYNRQLRQLTRR